MKNLLTNIRLEIMISIEKASQIIMKYLPKIRMEIRPLMKSCGLILAQDIKAPEPIPAFSNSAMDGYAIALPRKSIPHNGPILFPVVGESRAGVPFKDKLKTGTAVAISTGAIVPEGTDRIIPVENTSMIENKVQINNVGKPRAHIRFKGEETAIGDLIGTKSKKLTPALIARLAGFGITKVRVFVPPRVSILTTGEELIPVDQTPSPGQIRNTNQIFLHYFLGDLGITPTFTHHVLDTLEDTMTAIKEAKKVSDILLMSGGVSVGFHDYVKEAAEKIGFERRFWKVAQKPGKPFYFAVQGKQCLFGLPGNPVAMILTTLIYVYPFLKKLLGCTQYNLHTLPACFMSRIDEPNIGRAKLLLVKIESIDSGIATISPVKHQKSHMLSGVVNSDGFVIVTGNRKEILDHEIFPMRLFPWEDTTFSKIFEPEG